MGAFEYTAVDTAGRERKGVLEGDTARQVRQLLREKNLLPVAIQEVAQEEKKERGSSFTFRGGVSAADVSLLTRQLA
ncbi:MAG: type II secretion system protein GspF, partial [Povalibacter sp.]